MTIAPFTMIRLENPDGKFCWHNSAVFACIYLWRQCKIAIPEAPTTATAENYFQHFCQWLRFDRNELRSPHESLAMFTRDYLPNNSEDVRARTQDARMFFQAMAGEMRFGVDPVPEFDFMQPILQKRWTINRCMKCFAVPGKENKSFLGTKIYHRNFFCCIYIISFT